MSYNTEMNILHQNKSLFLKCTVFLLIGLTTQFLSAQYTPEFDETFLQSLPEETRMQLLSEISQKESLENDRQFKAPSTALSKEENSEDEDANKSFGIEYFRTFQSTFMPINEPSVDPSYILDIGDELLIQIVGSNNNQISATIKRDGTINLPSIERVAVAGLSLSKAGSLIDVKVSQSIIGAKAFTTLESLRDMQILVLGFALNPGIYTVPGNSNILNILSAAGGFADEANLRNISIIRNGKILKTIDLYKVLIYGDLSDSFFSLRSGDSILVKPSERPVIVNGGFNQTGLFELLPEESFSDILNYAQGLKPTAIKDEIQLIRVTSSSSKVYSYTLDQMTQQIIKAGDIIAVLDLPRVSVVISGAVERPGSYNLHKGSSIIDLVNIAGGYTENAYPLGGIYLNENAKENEKLVQEKTKKQLFDFIISAAGAESANLDIIQALDGYLDYDPIGRVSVNFALDALRADPQPTLLQDNDKIIIPEFQNTIHVYGDVENPGSFTFDSGSDLDYYLDLAGNTKDSAGNRVIVINPDGSSESLVLKRFALFSKSASFLYPGSLIYVPRDFELNIVQTTSVILPIVSNLALTIASIASLNN